MPNVGRNDPCPCGSGKKYKKCCLHTDSADAHGNTASEVADDLRELLGGRQFESLDEVQTLLNQQMEIRNHQGLDEFHGLSPDQMYRILHHPFSSPELVTFPDSLPSAKDTPIMRLFNLLADAIGDGAMKSTAKGNLPQLFCRYAAVSYWTKEEHEKRMKFTSINKEADFNDLHHMRIVAEAADLVKGENQQFTLTQKYRTAKKNAVSGSIYTMLLEAYCRNFNWAYGDRYPDFNFIQQAFLFTLFLLQKYGDTWQPPSFYSHNFIQAFPAILNDTDADASYFTPEEFVSNCYELRALIGFAVFLGLAEIDSDDVFLRTKDYKIRARRLLHEAVKFQFPLN